MLACGCCGPQLRRPPARCCAPRPAVVARQHAVQLHRAARLPRARGDTLRIGDAAGARVVHCRKTGGKYRVVPLHDFRRTPEISVQGQRFKLHAADTGGAGAEKHADLGFAKTVDGLHRVADQEQRAAIARLPARGEQREQLGLLQRCVLEFVDQDVADARVQAQRQIGWIIHAAQRGARRGSDRRIIDASQLSEDHLELGDRQSQQPRERAQHLGLIGAQLRVGQQPQFGEQFQRARAGRQVPPATRAAALQRRILGREALRAPCRRLRHSPCRVSASRAKACHCRRL